MKLKLAVFAITTVLFLGACSSFSPIGAVADALSPNDGVSVEAQVGKENTKQIVGQQNETVNKINGDQSIMTVNNTEIPLTYLVLLILGWLAPSPQEICRGIKNLFKRKN